MSKIETESTGGEIILNLDQQAVESAVSSTETSTIEGMSGFSFVEASERIETTATPTETPTFSLETAETSQDLANPIQAIALSSPTVGNIPLALCDDELLTEINTIPDRLAFKIGDVADLVQVKTYVLRYWETEFDILNPKKSKNNQRVYAKRDVENVMLIKKLLYRDRFSIEGARSALKQLRGQVKKERHLQTAQTRVEAAIERVHELLADVQKIRQLF
jgi:DNA-binding transcriptional MerR regulator